MSVFCLAETSTEVASKQSFEEGTSLGEKWRHNIYRTSEDQRGRQLDVASLALRLHKPLSARLFPVPGKQAGERTEFSSPYLTNTLVL